MVVVNLARTGILHSLTHGLRRERAALVVEVIDDTTVRVVAWDSDGASEPFIAVTSDAPPVDEGPDTWAHTFVASA